jgi:hypothetical protein
LVINFIINNKLIFKNFKGKLETKEKSNKIQTIKSNVLKVNKSENNQPIKKFRKSIDAIKFKINEYNENFMIKLRNMILDSNSDKLEYQIFISLVYFFTLLNFIALCNISYDISDDFAIKLFIINVFCSSFFAIEMIFKIIVLKKDYFSDYFNILDFLIVFAGIAKLLKDKLNSDPNGKLKFFIIIIFKMDLFPI